MRGHDTMRAADINEASLHTIRSNTEEMKQTAFSGTTCSTAMSRRTGATDIQEKERLFRVRTEDQTNTKSGITILTIKQAPLVIYNDLKKINLQIMSKFFLYWQQWLN